jgi:putative endonuclease
MSFWAYMLHWNAGRLYVGHTDNLERRLAEHESGIVEGFTAAYLPMNLVWSQEFSTRYEALTAERQIKGWSRAKKLALMRGDWERISFLAKSRTGLRQAQPERSGK